MVYRQYALNILHCNNLDFVVTCKNNAINTLTIKMMGCWKKDLVCKE